MNVDFVYLALWAAGTLVFVSVVAGLFSSRAGLSFLLVFLVAGMLVGEDGLGGVPFDDHRIVFWVGNAALAVILLDGGLQTTVATFRTGLKPAAWLATAGVVVTAAITGAAATWLLDVDWRLGLLAGAVVGSTDAAAVFSLMRSAGLRLSERLASTLEIESGLNDPMAVVLTLMLIGWVGASWAGAESPWTLLAMQAGIGLAGGVGAGFALAALLRRLPLVGTQRGLAALVLASRLLTNVLRLPATDRVRPHGPRGVHDCCGSRSGHSVGQAVSSPSRYTPEFGECGLMRSDRQSTGRPV